MSITLSSASLPVFQTALTNLGHFLDKAAANAASRKFDPDVFLTMRLAPDMLPFSAQIRIACDAAKFGVARVAGVEAPRHEDNETTLAQLRERINSTLTFLASVPAAALDGQEDKDVSFPIDRAGTLRTMKGEAYLKHWVLPNVYFHVTTAYAMLRHAGVNLGKADFLMGAAAAA
jgi:hypothetical protein